MYLFKQRNGLKNLAAALGVVLWVGILGPEIFMKSGTGCILDENGKELTAEDARNFMEQYFYGGGKDGGGEAVVNIKYKLALMEFFRDESGEAGRGYP